MILRIWLETLGVVCLAVMGAAAGWRCSKLRGLWWLAGYFVPLLFIVVVGLTRRIPELESTPPFAWLMAGRTEFALLAPVCTLLLTTPLSRLPSRRQRILIGILMVAAVGQASVVPFLSPAFNYRYLKGLRTTIDSQGICMQSNGYTCGPAAAVTALRRLGIEAQEGQLAILARTTRFTGTPADLLCLAIQKEHGVRCHPVCVRNITDLRGKEPFIAVVKYAFLIDHYVTVLNIGDSTILIGDPLVGQTEMSHEEFTRTWRRCGILLERGRADRAPDDSGQSSVRSAVLSRLLGESRPRKALMIWPTISGTRLIARMVAQPARPGPRRLRTVETTGR